MIVMSLMDIACKITRKDESNTSRYFLHSFRISACLEMCMSGMNLANHDAKGTMNEFLFSLFMDFRTDFTSLLIELWFLYFS